MLLLLRESRRLSSWRFFEMSRDINDCRIPDLLENCSSGSSDTCDSESEAEIDNVSQRTEESDSKQEGILDDRDEPETASRASRELSGVGRAFYTSKDGAKWKKDCPRSNIRTRSENIITNTAGVKGIAKLAKTEIECWSLFITDSLLNTILGTSLINDSLRIRQQNPHIPKQTRKRIAHHLGEPSSSAAPKKIAGRYVRCSVHTLKKKIGRHDIADSSMKSR